MRKSNYDKFPATKIDGYIVKGWDDVATELTSILKKQTVVALDMYVGIHEAEVMLAVENIKPDLILNTRDIFKSEPGDRQNDQAIYD